MTNVKSQFDAALAADMADDITLHGRAMVADTNGRRLLLTSTELLGLPGNQILLAYEGKGVIFFELDRPLNRFRLLSHGFPEKVADSICSLVNAVVSILADQHERRVEAVSRICED